jgi:hypothetical protein
VAVLHLTVLHPTQSIKLFILDSRSKKAGYELHSCSCLCEYEYHHHVCRHTHRYGTAYKVNGICKTYKIAIPRHIIISVAATLRRATVDTWQYIRHSVYVKCKGSEKSKYLAFSGTQCFTLAHHIITLLSQPTVGLSLPYFNHPRGLLSNSDAGELPRRKRITFRTRRKFAIKNTKHHFCNFYCGLICRHKHFICYFFPTNNILQYFHVL